MSTATPDHTPSPTSAETTSPQARAGAQDAPATPPTTSGTRPRSQRRSRARRSAFGSPRQLPSGRWQARYLDSDGTRRSAPRTFDTARAAEDWLATSRADLLRGNWHSPSVGAVPLETYAADYLAERVDLSDNTLSGYRRMLRLWLCADLTHPASKRRVNLGRLQLREITTASVREWHSAALAAARERAVARVEASDRHRRTRALHAAREWARENGYTVARTGRLPEAVLTAWREAGEPAAATLALPPTEPDRNAGHAQVAHAYAFLRSVLGTAHRDGLIPANPCTLKGASTIRSRERVPATPAEVAQIAEHMPERFAAAVPVAAYSGLRAGELFGLTRAHVDLSAGTVRVERALVEIRGESLRFGAPKTTSSLRTVHLPSPVTALLADHMAHHTAPGPDALIFGREDGSPLIAAQRTKMFREACAHVGRHDLRWHDLRHTGATLAAQAGASLRELQARIGHSTVNAAMRYQHATAERDRELADRLAAMIPATPEAPAVLRSVR